MLTKQKLIYQIKHHPVIRAAYEKLGSAALTSYGKTQEIDENLVLIVANTGKRRFRFGEYVPYRSAFRPEPGVEDDHALVARYAAAYLQQVQER